MSKTNLLKLLLLFFTLTGCQSHVPVEELPIYYEKPKEIYSPVYRMDPPKMTQLIVIDPGHGGEDFGTHSLIKPTYQEKSLNLATAHMLQEILQQKGYQTLMTRSDDRFISLGARAKFANLRQPLLFISVHFNSAPSRQAQGIEVYYYKSEVDKGRTSKSKKLAELVLGSILTQTNGKSRGVKPGDFAVIRETNMPAILVEGGFLTNEEEMKKIKDPAYLKKLAYGMAQGIQSFMNSTL